MNGGVALSGGARRPRDTKPLGQVCQSLTTPTATQRDGNRQHPRPLAPRETVDLAYEFSKERVGIELFADDGQEGAGPRETSRACGEQSQLAWTKLTPPAVRIDLLFGPEASLQVFVDVGDAGSDLAHRLLLWSGAMRRGARRRERRAWAVRVDSGVWGAGRDVPARRGPGLVHRGQETAGGAIEGVTSVLPGRVLTESRQSLHVAPDRTGVRLVHFRQV